MTCYHPIRALVIGETDNGKKDLKFVGKDYDNTWRKNDGTIVELWPEILIPCGKCIGCTIDRSRQWATRMMLEMKYHERACFVTLTYSDDNLPLSGWEDDKGEWHESYSLAKSDLQRFMKRLRRHYEPEKIRFFACGEYGDKTRRPHYHAILFGIDFHEDRKVFKTDKGIAYYRSPTLEKLWTDGHSMITDVHWNTCAYVSRYCTKKYYGRRNIYYQTFGIVPEFNVMSRRPGIGAQYFEEHKDEVYINQEIFLANNKGGFKTRPPAYFDRLYDLEYPEEMERIKENRKAMAEMAMRKKLEGTDKDLYEYLKVQEKIFKEKIIALKREKI